MSVCWSSARIFQLHSRHAPDRCVLTQVVGPAMAKLPVFGASFGLQPDTANSTKRSVPTSAFVDASDPACAARCNTTAGPAAVSNGGR